MDPEYNSQSMANMLAILVMEKKMGLDNFFGKMENITLGNGVAT